MTPSRNSRPFLAVVHLLLATFVATASAQDLAERIGLDRGVVLIVGKEAGPTAIDLAKKTELTVYVQSPDGADARQVRELAEKEGLLGDRVYVDVGPPSRLHLAPDLADAVVVRGDADRDELLRVLRPGGKLISGKKVGTKPVPPGAGEWTHPYHGPDNNPQADDTIARAPYRTRFLTTPWYGPMPQVTVSAGGRIFKAFGYISFKKREWALLNTLVGMNAYNGVRLWKRDLTKGFMLHRNTLIASADTLFLGDDTSCKLIDAATGKVRGEIKIPGAPVWKWMALDGGVLYALVGGEEFIDKTIRGTRTRSGWPWNGLGPGYARRDYPWGHGRTLLAVDPGTQKVLWSRTFEEKIDSRVTCMKAGRIFVYAHGKYLAAVNVKDGKDFWKSDEKTLLGAVGRHDKAQTPSRGYSSQTYAKCSDKVVYLAGPQRRKLVAVSAETGSLLWEREGGNVQLVLHDGALYAMGRTSKSLKLDPLTGKVLATFAFQRGNCTRATGTVDAIFARGPRHGGTLRVAAGTDTPRRLASMRPGCQDGVIAANGLLYWGPWMCDCNHSLVGIISLGPAGAEKRAAAPPPLTVSKNTAVAQFRIHPNDWPTYRGDNRRRASTKVSLPGAVDTAWTFDTQSHNLLTAPVTAGGLVFVSGSDGVVRAIDGATGKPRWKAYVGGAVRYPPTVDDGRVLVGSGDGRVYAFEAASGRELWRFRAAPEERRMPVYGRLTSTWPVNSGVLVEDGVAYAAAGIASHDGTYVYALDAATGRVKWSNDESGRLLGDNDAAAGVAVQGHLLLDDGRLYMAGGNVVSPAIYEIEGGRCLNKLTNEWQKAPRGSELFFHGGKVEVTDRAMNSPRGYIPSRYFANYLAQASSDSLLVRGTKSGLACLDGNRKKIWERRYFVDTDAVVLTANAVLVAGTTPNKKEGAKPTPSVLALKSSDGEVTWGVELPARPAPWGLCVDREGRVIVTLEDGRVICLRRS